MALTDTEAAVLAAYTAATTSYAQARQALMIAVDEIGQSEDPRAKQILLAVRRLTTLQADSVQAFEAILFHDAPPSPGGDGKASGRGR